MNVNSKLEGCQVDGELHSVEFTQPGGDRCGDAVPLDGTNGRRSVLLAALDQQQQQQQ